MIATDLSHRNQREGYKFQINSTLLNCVESVWIAIFHHITHTRITGSLVTLPLTSPSVWAIQAFHSIRVDGLFYLEAILVSCPAIAKYFEKVQSFRALKFFQYEVSQDRGDTIVCFSDQL